MAKVRVEKQGRTGVAPHDWRAHYRGERAKQTLAWAELLDAFDAELVRREVEGTFRSRSDYRSILNTHTRLEFGEIRDARALRPEMLDAWARAQLAERVPEGTVHGRLAVVRALLEWARIEGIVDENVAKRLTVRVRKRPRDPGRAEAEVLDLAAMTRLACDPRLPDWRRLLWMLVLWTGLRIGEAAGLSWRDLHRRAPLWELRLVEQYHTKRRALGPLKGGLPRRIPVAPVLLERLECARMGFRVMFGRSPRDDEPIATFPQTFGRPRRDGARGSVRPVRWREKTALLWWHRDLETIGVPVPSAGPHRVHATRHTFDTVLTVTLGVPERIVRAISHDTRAENEPMAFGRYVHIGWPAMCAAVAKLAFDPEVLADCARRVREGAVVLLLDPGIRTLDRA